MKRITEPTNRLQAISFTAFGIRAEHGVRVGCSLAQRRGGGVHHRQILVATPLRCVTLLTLALFLFLISFSNQSFAQVTPVTLYDPTNVTDTSVDLSWSQNNDQFFIAYEVHKSTQANFTIDETTLDGTVNDQGTTSYQVTGLTPNTTYYFKVRVATMMGYGDSNEVNATTQAGGGGPTPVTLNAPTNITANSMDLSWSQNTDPDFAKYEVHKAITANLTPDASSLEMTITSQTQTSYTVEGLTPNQTYYFKVRVVNTSNETGDSNEVSGATLGSGLSEQATYPSQNAQMGATMGVFVHSGELRRQELDLVIKGRGFDFRFARTYRSRIDYNGPLGVQWDFNYNASISKDGNGDALVQNGEGRIYRFAYDPMTQTYSAPAGVYWTLTENADGTWTWKQKHGTSYSFDSLGTLTSIKDRNNNEMTFGYDAGSRLTSITDTLGRTITLNYNNDGRIAELVDFANRKVTYAYSADGDLVSVTSPSTTRYPNGKTVEYTYSSGDTDESLNHNLLTIKNGRGEIWMTNTYDTVDRVASQQLGDGTITTSYNPTASSTLITDRNGNQVEWYYDFQGLPVQEVVYTRGVRPGDPTSFTTYYEYNSDLELTKTTLPAANVIKATYDSNGNITEIRRQPYQRANDPGDLVKIFTYTTDFNLVATSTDERGYTTTLTYDANGNLLKTTYPTVNLGQPTGQIIEVNNTYNSFGQLLTTTGAEGNVTQYDYYATGPSTGYLQRIVKDPGGLNITKEFQYDSVGNVTAITDRNGNTTTLTVNELNQITKVTAPSPLLYSAYIYYDANNAIEQIDIESGDAQNQFLTATFTHNSLNKRLAQTREVDNLTNVTTTYEYDGNQNLKRILKPEGNDVTAVYDERDLIYTITKGAGAEASTVTVSYTTNGKRSELIDGNGVSKTINYDSFDRVIEIIDALSNKAEVAYDAASNVTSIVRKDSTGLKLGQRDTLYDEINRAYQIDDKLLDAQGNITGTVTTINLFDKNSRRTKVTDDNGNQSTFEYDALSRLTRAIDALNNKVELAYDGADNVTTITEREQNQVTMQEEVFVTTKAYDELNRVISVTDNAGNVTQLTYDALGNVTLKTDAEGNTINYTYDGLNRLLQETKDMRDEVGQIIDTIDTSYAYDGNSRLTTLTDGNSNATSYAYDTLDRRITETFADLTTRSYIYDSNSNILTRTDQNGVQTSYTYDALNRLLSKTDGVITESYQYDDLSRMTQATLSGNGSSTVTFQYDSLSRRISETQNGKVISSEYDGVGNRLKLTRPDASYITYQPDALNRIDTIKDQLSQTIADYDYAGRRRVAKRSHLNGTKLDVSYDSVKNVISYLNKDSSNTDIASFEYGYDKVHNRKYEKRLHDGGIGDVYIYDDVYRLVKVKYDVPDPVNDFGAPSSVVDFNYDGLGNRDSVVTDSVPTYYTHNNMNEYDDVGGAPQVHDSNGNLTDDGTYLYTWDYENRLIEVRLKADNSFVAHYYYDALNRRIEKQTPTETIRYYYDGPHVVEERDGVDTVLAHYTYGRKIDEILAMERGGQTYYFHTNALGSVSAVTDSSGSVAERYTYTVYGQMSITDGQGVPLSTSAIGSPYGFTGRRYDEETGLWYYRNRYYDPVTGRFISRDPLGYVAGINLYHYVKSNPLNYADPFGLQEEDQNENNLPVIPLRPKLKKKVKVNPQKRGKARPVDPDKWIGKQEKWIHKPPNEPDPVKDLAPGKANNLGVYVYKQVNGKVKIGAELVVALPKDWNPKRPMIWLVALYMEADEGKMGNQDDWHGTVWLMVFVPPDAEPGDLIYVELPGIILPTVPWDPPFDKGKGPEFFAWINVYFQPPGLRLPKDPDIRGQTGAKPVIEDPGPKEQQKAE